MRSSLVSAFLFLTCLSAVGASAAETGAPTPAPIPAPQDVAYPGTIELNVDATDVTRGVFRVRERIPVAQAGPLTLLFPRWLPGWHRPGGEIEKLAGLVITANGAPTPWTRDSVDVTAFHVDAAAGTEALDLSFQFVSATDSSQGYVVTAPNALVLEWNETLLYPAGYYANRINVATRVTLPAGWSYAAALGHGTATSAPVTFAPTDLATLVDSPLFAGRYARRVDLDPRGRSPVFLNLFGDRPDQVAASDAQIALYRNLVRQADLLFGARHFDHYDFLLTLSDRLSDSGLEHHRSSENVLGGGYFTEWSDYVPERDLLAHELTHSWNGKYRRPSDLLTANYNTPMQDSLLWVYEGQTQFWGYVLAARSGLWSRAETLEALAITAATLNQAPGRHWRPLQDTTSDPIIAGGSTLGWTNWQRSEDYYDEGQLLWLDVDMLIRERTHNRRSLDDFARAFFGGHDGAWSPVAYRFDDVVAALNGVTPYDWAGFLRARLTATSTATPLDGLTRSGYRLVFNEERSDFQKAIESERKTADFMFSLGFSVGEDDEIAEVLWDGPAFNQGLTRGAKLIAVNGADYDADGLRRAISEAKADAHPIELLIKVGGHYRSLSIDYHGGLRYPHLERIVGTPDRLGALLSPRAH
ncbi:MAG TPA: peptidase M61 [Caulobacterales bacterium]|nr:peptidase M61 [Caulobacterales bacterium]